MSSPDITHRVVTNGSDNLPQLANQIYGDTTEYDQITNINKLDSLKSGTTLLFPPDIKDIEPIES